MPAAITENLFHAAVSFGSHLALDGGSPCLASSYVATWPSPAGDDELHVLRAIRRSARPGPGQGQVQRLERRWREATGRDHIVACRSATAAARLAMHCLEIGPGDEVICPADAFLSSMVLTATSGAVPVLVDIDPHTFQLDPVAVESAVTPRTRLILGVDRYGTTPDFRALGALSRRYGFHVLEDGSQARGALFDGRPVGSLGTASFCALAGVSRQTVLGQGGVFATDDENVAAIARRALLVDEPIGAAPVPVQLEPAGWTYPMTELDAAVAEAQLSSLEDDVAVRSANGAHLARRLHEIPGLDLPTTVRGASHVYTSLPVLLLPDELGLPDSAVSELRNTVIDCMTAEGLWLDRWAPQPVGVDVDLVEYRAAAAAGQSTCRRSDFPTTDAVADAAFVIGNDRSSLGAPHTIETMDRIADCFTKVLVDNLDRVRQLATERTSAAALT